MKGSNEDQDLEQQPVSTESEAEQEFSEAWAEDEPSSDDTSADDDDLPTLDEEDQMADTPAPSVSGSGEQEPGEDELEAIQGEVEKLQQRLRSAEGRLRNQQNPKLEDEVAQMRRQLEQMQQLAGGDDPSGAQPANSGTDDDEDFIPDGFTKDEWETFQNDYPSNAQALKAKFKDSSDVDQRLAKLEQDRAAREQEEARRQFEAPILDAHPDYQEICSQHAADVMEFVKSLDDPIKRQGAELVIQQGTPEQIIALVTEFKGWRASKGKTAKPKTTPTRDPSAATAVPSRGGSRASVAAGSALNKDDYESAWNEAKVD